MDFSYAKKKLMRCMKYLDNYPDVWEKLSVKGVCCPSTMEEMDERYDAWVECYYGMDEKEQACFSEYWFPLAGESYTCLAFVDLLAPGLPVISVEPVSGGHGVCVCSSLSRLVRIHKARARSRGRWI